MHLLTLLYFLVFRTPLFGKGRFMLSRLFKTEKQKGKRNEKNSLCNFSQRRIVIHRV